MKEAQKLNLAKSMALFEQAKNFVPGGVLGARRPGDFIPGEYPIFLEHGKGGRVTDVDGNQYIDYIAALLPVILGYGHPAVDAAIKAQLAKGVSFSLPHPLEVELSERLVEIIPCAEMVRFGKNGSDATAGAVRAARAYTGRELVAACGYHGWQDWYIGSTLRHRGVPEAVRQLTLTFKYNDLASLQALFDAHPGQIAAVIMEPVTFTAPEPGFLQGVVDLAHKNGALAIFDEIITGLRWALGGAQQYFGVTPDLACFGKSLGNGLPISAVVGRREVMEIFDEIFFSFTFGGETLALAAGLAVLEVMEREAVIARLWQNGARLQERVNQLAADHGLGQRVVCDGYPIWSHLSFRDEAGQESMLLRSLFQQEATKRGVLILVTHNLGASHEDVDFDLTLSAYDQAMDLLVQAIDDGRPERFLAGPAIRPVFRVRG
jgi:glutamate-1-semialdehyde aminotransferase